MKKKVMGKGISRIESASTKGWFVRCYRNKKTYSKLFSDKKNGGKNKALMLAKVYRDSLVRKIQKIPKAPRARRIVTKDSRNTTGILGVCHTIKKSVNGNPHECYSVSWRPEPGVQKCTSFSVRKYGRKRAFELAVRLRRQKIGRVLASI